MLIPYSYKKSAAISLNNHVTVATNRDLKVKSTGNTHAYKVVF